MNLVKNKLRTSMGDDCLNNYLVTFIERDVFMEVSEDDIVMFSWQSNDVELPSL